MKVLTVKMPDGSVWGVPVDVIARNRAAYYADKEFDGDIEMSLSEDTWPLFNSRGGDSDAIDWATNNMNWSDVNGAAFLVNTQVEPPDYQEGWMNGEHEIVEMER